jgi:hypothetical protein
LRIHRLELPLVCAGFLQICALQDAPLK